MNPDAVKAAQRIEKRWAEWGDEGPANDDIPRRHIEDLEAVATAFMSMNAEPQRLIQDNDCHWYVIPCFREDDFRNWVTAMEQSLDWNNEWEPKRVNGPHMVQFYDWDE